MTRIIDRVFIYSPQRKGLREKQTKHVQKSYYSACLNKFQKDLYGAAEVVQKRLEGHAGHMPTPSNRRTEDVHWKFVLCSNII
jgi:hypothetical protein